VSVLSNSLDSQSRPDSEKVPDNGSSLDQIAIGNQICSQIDPEALNERELLEYYHLKGTIGGLKLKERLFRNYVLQKLANNPPHPRLTVAFQRMRGIEIGMHVYIGPFVQIDLLYPHLVRIEDYVSIGMNCMIFAHSNPTCSVWLKKNLYGRTVAPVTIKTGAWIPPGTIILHGVTIGEHSVIGAGSVVIDDVEPYTLAAGRPARPIKKLV